MHLRLNDGKQMPQLGFGAWKVSEEEASSVIRQAIGFGYRLIDTASVYKNEHGVGIALSKSDVKRGDLFVTTKIWNSEQGYQQAINSLEQSLTLLNTNYVDLLLIHWPGQNEKRFVETWRALIRLKEAKCALSIGVANFTIENLQALFRETGVLPAVNQIELHPYFQQTKLRSFHQKHSIVTQCWSPLGKGVVLKDETISQIAARYKKTPAQLVLRWHIQNGVSPIPKSSNPQRMKENRDVEDFKIAADDMIVIAGLDSRSGRIGRDPHFVDW